MKHLIYSIKNPDGEIVYVGKHSCRGTSCSYNPTGAEVCNYMGSGKLLFKTYKKYGRASFNKFTLLETYSENSALLYEEYLITQLKNRGLCKYNIELGGTAWGLGRIISDETKARMSESAKKRKASPELRAKLSKISSERTPYIRTASIRNKTSNSLKGRTFSEEHKNKIRKNCGNSCSIEGVEYCSYVEASRELPLSAGQIRRRVISNEYPEWFKI